jgi:DNA-binding IclR family transcriptional regulator
MKQDKDKKSIYKVQALERALDILDCFSFQDRELSLTDVVHRTGLNKTTVKRLISNLTTRGYLHQDPPSKKYQLGMRLFELGGIVFSSFSLRQAASYPMTRLQNEADATVLLGVNMEDQLVYVDKREGKGIIRVSSEVGWRRPLNYGMLGMVLMSSLDPQDVKRVLKKYPLKPYTPLSITDADAFSLRLGQIREEAVESVIGIAAPIRDYSRHVVAALGIALPAGLRNQNDDLDLIIDLVKNACETISSDLGYLKI